MSRILSSTRYLLLVPILGGIGLISEVSKETALYSEQFEAERGRDPAPRKPKDNRKDRPQGWA